MLKVPQLDDITYDQMMSRAINRIPGRTGQWTDFNAHDPGITVLQTYGWLVDMLNYYMNATGDMHLHKYLKLLGIRQRKAQAAGAYLNVESSLSHMVIPKGMPVYAGNTVFEIAESCGGGSNHFVSYINEVDGTGMDLTMFAGADGDFADIFAEYFEHQAIAYFGFEKELSHTVSLQVRVEEKRRRNDFETGFSLSRLRWEYYGEEGWSEIQKVEDETGGFLRSGFVKLDFPAPTKLYGYGPTLQKAHYVRCILQRNTYDCLPRIGGISVNPVWAEQKESFSKSETILYEGQERVLIPCFIPKDAYLMVGVEEEQRGYLIYDGGDFIEGGVSVIQGEQPWQNIIDFTKGGIRPKTGSLLRVFVLEQSFTPDFVQGYTDGCAGQELDFLWPGLFEVAVSTWRKGAGGRHRYQLWSRTDELERAGCRDRVFTYDEERQKLVFGDGIHGAVPDQGQKLCITGLTISKFAEGNVMEGEINLMKAPGFEGINIKNPCAAVGGCELESVPHMMEHLEQTLFLQKRMVAREDYIEAVCASPGLLIEAVEVISGKRYGEIHSQEYGTNEVFLVVKPYSDREKPVLSGFYKNQILKHIEDKRLINTKVSVVQPSYVGVEVNGRIKLANLYPGEREAVLACIRESILLEEGENGFGRDIVLGKLFAQLEMMKEVQRIQNLSLERIGTGAVKNQRGDLILYEDALSYLRDIQIEFS